MAIQNDFGEYESRRRSLSESLRYSGFRTDAELRRGHENKYDFARLASRNKLNPKKMNGAGLSDYAYGKINSEICVGLTLGGLVGLIGGAVLGKEVSSVFTDGSWFDYVAGFVTAIGGAKTLSKVGARIFYDRALGNLGIRKN